ncbi:hypothetical protein D6D89_04755 [Moraxella catarrhalis]|nr:hypothetical protein D6D89_04755 [Moraxella catarrhalis]
MASFSPKKSVLWAVFRLLVGWLVGWLVGSFCKIPFRVSSKIFYFNKLFDKHKASLSYKKRRAIGTPLFL